MLCETIDGTVARHLSIWKERTRDMKKNAFIRKTVVLFLTIISVLGLQLISVNAKSPTYQQVPTMAYLKVERHIFLMQIQHLSCFMNR